MSLVSSRLLKRVTAGLASGMVFAGVAGVGYWVGSAARGPRSIPKANGSSGWEVTSSPEVNPIERSGTVGPVTALAPGPSASGLPGHLGASPSNTTFASARARDGTNTEDDSALFAALDRLERRMAVGMIRARDSVVALEYTAAEGPPGSRRVATGVVINSGGDVLSVRIDPPVPTSAPGAGAEKGGQMSIVAQDASGGRHFVSWVASDPESGLTLLRIAPRAVPPIQIAAEEPTLGSQVFVVGNPFGLGHSVSRGHIAGLDRALKLGTHQLGGLIQVQAPLYPGDSGAVVANLRGQLIGLIRSGLAIPITSNDRAERDNDFGFALPARDVLWVVDQLRARGRVDRAYLGVRLEPTTGIAAPRDPSITGSKELPGETFLLEGAILQEVLAGTPAALAGLKAGDTVIAIDGRPVRSSHDLTDRLDRLPSQTGIRLEVVRGRGPERQRLTVQLRTCSRPDMEEQAVRSPAASSLVGQPKSPRPTQIGPSLFPVVSVPPPLLAPVAVVPKAIPAPVLTASAVITPVTGAPLSSAPVPPGVETKAVQVKARAHTEVQKSAALEIPAPARSHLRSPVPPLQPEELKLTLPPAVADRLQQLERRLEKLERQSVPVSEPRQASSAHSP